jgi:hypothetical protein
MPIQTTFSDVEFSIGVPLEKVLVLGFQDSFRKIRPFDLICGLLPELKVRIKRLFQSFVIGAESSFNNCPHAGSD